MKVWKRCSSRTGKPWVLATYEQVYFTWMKVYHLSVSLF